MDQLLGSMPGLSTVSGLRAFRTQAVEPIPVSAVKVEHVEAIYPHLPLQVKTMIQVQLLTGMRPGEVRKMTPQQIFNRENEIWSYFPESHKTQHLGKTRVIQLGRKVQRVLKPWLEICESDFCFKSSRAKDNIEGEDRGCQSYSKDGYCRAVRVACDKAGIPPWSPNQIRHTFASKIRQKYGLEAAQVSLGHSKADVTQIYAERNLKLANQVVSEIG